MEEEAEPPPRKKARRGAVNATATGTTAATTTTLNPTMKCPICWHVIFSSKVCAKGHVICGECFRELDKQPRHPSPPKCPLCRTQDIWYPNLVLDQLIQEHHPIQYTQRALLHMDWPALKEYILRDIDLEFCYEQTEPTDALNVAMHITAIKQVMKMAHVEGFEAQPEFQVPENLSSMVYTFLPVTGFRQFGGVAAASTTHTTRETLKQLLEHACLLYNSVGYYIKKQYFLVTCRYRFDEADKDADAESETFSV